MSKLLVLLSILSFSLISFSGETIQDRSMPGDTTAEPCSNNYCGCTTGGDDKNCAADSKTAVNCEDYCSAAYGGDSEDSCTLKACGCTDSYYTDTDSKSCSITNPGPQGTPVTYVSNCGTFCCNFWGGCP